MAAPVRALLSDLPKGHEFPSTSFELPLDYVRTYLAATGDDVDYEELGFAPPLAIAARALGGLLEVMELPAGSLHTGQELEMKAGISPGAALELSGKIAQRSERAGLIIAVLEFQVSVAGEDEPALVGRTTVVMPQSTQA